MQKLRQQTKESIRSIHEKGFFHFLSSKIFIKIFGFTSQIFVAFWLSPTQIGTIKIIQTYFSISSILAGFGFNSSTLKLCSEDRPNPIKRFLFSQAIKYTITTSTTVVIILILLSYFHLFSPDPEVNKFMIVLSIALIPFTLNNLYLSYFQANLKIKLLSKIQIATKFVGIVLIILLTYLFLINGYFIGLISGYFLTFLTIIITDRRINIQHIKKVENPFRSHLNYASISMITNILGMVLLSIDLLLLNFLIEDRESIGFYSFALLFIGVMRMIGTTINQISIPFFSRSQHDTKKILEKYHKYARKNFLLGIFLLIVSNIGSYLLMTYAFGGKYSESVLFFLLLSIAWFFRHLLSLKGGLLFGIGEIKLNLRITILSLLFALPVLTLSIIHYGVLGAAYASILCSIFTYLINAYYFTRLFKVNE